MTNSRQVLSGWIRTLDGQFEIPVDEHAVCSHFDVALCLGEQGLKRARDDGKIGEDVWAAVARSQPKDGLFIAGRNPTIYLAGAEGKPLPARSRFTWAHELGHYLLWRSTGQSAGSSYWNIERDCNWFAAELLVPQSQLLSIVGQPSRAWLGLVSEVRRKCNVSWDVAAGSMTAYSKGRVLFLKGELAQSPNTGRSIRITASSAAHFCGHHLGRRAIIRDYIFLERCWRLEDGERLITRLSNNIAKLPTKDCFTLAWRRGDKVDMMIRTNGLPREGSLD